MRISANQLTEPSSSSSEGDDAAVLQGLVISHFGQQLEIEPLEGSLQNQTVRCFQRANLPRLVTGDKVLFQLDSQDTGVILSAQPRNNVFARPGFKGLIKPVAANIDKVLVVIAVLPEPFMNLTDRYLVAIESLNLDPIIVLNKADLVNEKNRPHIDNMMSIYKGIGYDTHRVSASTGMGMAELESELAGLSRQDSAAVGRLSIGKEKGTHTTTTARLFHLGTFDLVDSPGIREFNLGHIEPTLLIEGYRELSALKGQCKFRDCAHQSEPACAILAAVENGLVSRERLSNYFQILQSIGI